MSVSAPHLDISIHRQTSAIPSTHYTRANVQLVTTQDDFMTEFLKMTKHMSKTRDDSNHAVKNGTGIVLGPMLFCWYI